MPPATLSPAIARARGTSYAARLVLARPPTATIPFLLLGPRIAALCPSASPGVEYLAKPRLSTVANPYQASAIPYPRHHDPRRFLNLWNPTNIPNPPRIIPQVPGSGIAVSTTSFPPVVEFVPKLPV